MIIMPQAFTAFRKLFDEVRNAILHGREHSLQPVINATGIILHTNLGRAPIAEETIAAIRESALGYSNLEFDLTPVSAAAGTALLNSFCVI